MEAKRASQELSEFKGQSNKRQRDVLGSVAPCWKQSLPVPLDSPIRAEGQSEGSDDISGGRGLEEGQGRGGRGTQEVLGVTPETDSVGWVSVTLSWRG